jgi:Rieske Fe-S protein
MSNGTVYGMLLSDMILDRKNSWMEIFDPGRFNPTKDLTKARERGFGVTLQSDSGSESVEMGEREIRVKRVCTHMGCQVNWNNAERSWVCPCHGSRFKSEGGVIRSPATRPLPRKGEDA